MCIQKDTYLMIKIDFDDTYDLYDTIGVDWYVRLMRNNEIECDATGYAFFKPKPGPFNYIRKSTDLYRYYIFK